MTLKLFTGGKAGVARLNLFQIHAWAEEIERPPLDGGADTWSDVPEKAIDPASLTVLDRHPGADGNLWLVLPDNSPGIDITVKAPRCHHFDANATAGKYHPYINLQTSTTNADLDTDTPEVCVGQPVSFALTWDASPPGLIYEDITAYWHLPPKFVNQQTNYSSTCSTYVLNPDLLTNTAIQGWFYNTNNGHVSAGMNLHFNNGQYVSVAANGNFTVFRPTVSLVSATNVEIVLDTNNLSDIYLGIGQNDDGGGLNEMHWDVYASVKTIFHGSGSYVQLVNRNFSWDEPYYFTSLNHYDTTSGGLWLDTKNPYSTSGMGYTATNMDMYFGDDPELDGPFYSFADCNDSFKTYACFQPDGGIPVTIGRVDWGWHGKTVLSGGAWSLTTNTITGPTLDATDDAFPLWQNVYHK